MNKFINVEMDDSQEAERAEMDELAGDDERQLEGERFQDKYDMYRNEY
jgi:hypothetical protein